jgi:hypothetical protein
MLIVGICFIGVFGALIYDIWQIHKNRKISIEKGGYLELKYGFNLLIALFTVIISMSMFIGYATYKDIKNDIYREIDKNLNERFGVKLDQMDKDINSRSKVLSELSANSSRLGNEYVGLANIQKRLSEQVKQSVYVVCNQTGDRVNFKDLKTKEGNILPVFIKPPTIFLQIKTPDNSYGGPAYITEVTKDYVQLIPGGGFYPYDMLIFE